MWPRGAGVLDAAARGPDLLDTDLSRDGQVMSGFWEPQKMRARPDSVAPTARQRRIPGPRWNRRNGPRELMLRNGGITLQMTMEKVQDGPRHQFASTHGPDGTDGVGPTGRNWFFGG